jgi:hypothetical protein
VGSPQPCISESFTRFDFERKKTLAQIEAGKGHRAPPGQDRVLLCVSVIEVGLDAMMLCETYADVSATEVVLPGSKMKKEGGGGKKKTECNTLLSSQIRH